MNLIEQLGGYELAKQVFDSIPKDGNSYSITRDDTGASFKSGEIYKALLEYRRENNIFEVGDKVVVKDQPFWPEDYMIHNMEQEHIGKWYMSAWRHATDEEIKAGKRL